MGNAFSKYSNQSATPSNVVDNNASTNIGSNPFNKYTTTTKNITTKEQPNDKKLRSSDLYKDREFIKASRQIYKYDKGKDFIGTDEQVAKWGLGNLSDYEWDITKTVGVAADVKNFDASTAEAWNTSLNKYEQLENFTLGGIGRGLRYTATDPTFVPSLFLGFGAGKVASLAGKKGAQVAAKFAIKKAVTEARKKAIKEAASKKITGKARKELVEGAVKKASFNAKLNTTALVAGETGLYSAVDNYSRQVTEKNLNRNGRADQEGINVLELGISTGIGAGLGGILGYGIPALVRTITKSKAGKEVNLPDKIYSDQDTIDIAKQQTKIDAPISSTTKAASRIAAETLQKNPNATILSYGSGDVKSTVKEVNELKQSGAKVDAYDLEPNMVDVEKGEYRPEYNPYSLDNQYDVVNASNVLDNLGSKQNAYNKARRIITQIGKSTKEDGSVVINPSKKGSITQKKLNNILEEKFEKVEWNSEEGFFKASIPIEKIVVEVGEDGVPIKKQNKTLLFIKKNFTSDAGAGETIAAGRRLQRTLINKADKQISYDIRMLEKAAKKEYGGYDNIPPRLMAQLNAGAKGKTWEIENLLPKTKKAVLAMRDSIDNIQQELLDAGAIKKGSDLETKIIKSMSSTYKQSREGAPLKFYMNTSYDVFNNPNYKVKPEARKKGVQFFIDQLSTSTDLENKLYRVAKEKQTKLDILKKNNKKIKPEDELTELELSKINEYEGQGGVVDQLVDNLTVRQGDDYVSQLDKLLSKGPSIGKGAINILKQKGNVDPAIAGLLGETTDLKKTYIDTITKMTKVLGNYEFNKAIQKSAAEAGAGFPKTKEVLDAEARGIGLPIVQKGSSGDYNVKVSSLSSDKQIEDLVKPLEDIWTTQAFKDIIEQGTELITPVTKSTFLKLYDNFLVAKAFTQISKTAYSVASGLRNWYGAGISALANGYINPFKLIQAGNAFKQLAVMPEGKAKGEIEKITLLGVLDSDVRVQSMIGLAKDVDSNFLMQSTKFLPKIGKILSKKSLDIYQSYDNFWKWYAFLNEKGRYRNVLRDKGIDPDKVVKTFRSSGEVIEITSLDEYAAKMVRENMHNYGETSRLVKLARKSPFTDFISFRTEMFRTSKNILKNSIKDLKEGTAQMKQGERNLDGSLKGIAQFKAGVIRMGGASAALVSSGALTATFVKINGLDEVLKGSSYTKQEAIEEFDADYNKGADYIYLSEEKDGKGFRFNMSYIDPFALFKQPVQAVIRAFQTGDDPDVALEKSSKFIMTNFLESVGPSMLTQALYDIYRNQDEYGRSIAKNNGVVKDTVSRLAKLWEAFEPGTITSARRIYQSTTKGGVTPSGQQRFFKYEALGLLGLKKEQYNIKKSLPLKLIEPIQELNNANKEYKKSFRNYRGTNPQEFVNLYLSSQKKKFKAAQQMYKTVQAAKAAGLSEEDIIMSITKDGFFLENFTKQHMRTLVKDGSFIPDKPETKALRKYQIYIKTVNKEAVEGLPKARDSLWDIYNQYNNIPLVTYKKEEQETRTTAGNPFAKYR